MYSKRPKSELLLVRILDDFFCPKSEQNRSVIRRFAKLECFRYKKKNIYKTVLQSGVLVTGLVWYSGHEDQGPVLSKLRM